MDLQQTKILLEKINSLYKSINIDQGKMATIERDLMLSYLRQLYELFSEAGPQNSSQPNVEQKVTTPKEEETQTQEPRPTPEPLRRTYKPPRIIEIPDTSREDNAGPTEEKRSTPPPKEEKPSEPVAEQPKTEQKPPKREQQPRPTTTSAGANPEIEALFEQRRATELSEKLSESPVEDLTKSMAINDRLLYMNDLFGKSMNVLDENLRQLNRFRNMEEAKPLLTALAERFHWTEEEREETAKAFIKLVRRRYL